MKKYWCLLFPSGVNEVFTVGPQDSGRSPSREPSPSRGAARRSPGSTHPPKNTPKTGFEGSLERDTFERSGSKALRSHRLCILRREGGPCFSVPWMALRSTTVPRFRRGWRRPFQACMQEVWDAGAIWHRIEVSPRLARDFAANLGRIAAKSVIDCRGNEDRTHR